MVLEFVKNFIGSVREKCKIFLGIENKLALEVKNFPLTDERLLRVLNSAGIKRVQDPLEWKEFSNFISEYFSKHKNLIVVEIGTQSGGVFFSLYNILYHNLGKLISIDNRLYSKINMAYPKKHYANEYKCFDNFARKLKDDRLFTVIGDSHSNKVKNIISKILKGAKIDLCFIDGDHSYNGVKKDFLMYKELMESKGLMCFHDINTPQTFSPLEIDVKHFWHEIKERVDYKEIIHSPVGIGILKAKGVSNYDKTT